MTRRLFDTIFDTALFFALLMAAIAGSIAAADRAWAGSENVAIADGSHASGMGCAPVHEVFLPVLTVRNAVGGLIVSGLIPYNEMALAARREIQAPVAKGSEELCLDFEGLAQARLAPFGEFMSWQIDVACRKIARCGRPPWIARPLSEPPD